MWLDLETIRRKLREEQNRQGGGKSQGKQGNAVLDPQVREIQGGDADLPPGKMKVIIDKYTYALIDTPEEKARKREKIPQDEQQRLTDVI